MKKRGASGIELTVRTGVRPVLSRKALVKKTAQVLGAMKRRGSGLGILLTNDAEIKKLNFRFRGKRKATDVLSFPSGDDVEGYLGDVVISVPTAVRQAKEYGVPVREEILRLVAHGVLHLLGYEHEGVSKRKASLMAAKERELHRMLGVRAGLELEE